LDKLAFYSNAVVNELQVELAEKIGAVSGYPDYQLFMVNSGAEAIENALKLASFKNNRSKIIAFERGFHGRTSAAVHVTDNPKISAKINKGFEREILPWNDLATVKKHLLKEDVCAVLEIRGMGCMIGLKMPFPVKAFRSLLVEKFGVFTGSSSQPDTLRILPPLTVSESEVNEFIEKFTACLSAYQLTSEK